MVGRAFKKGLQVVYGYFRYFLISIKTEEIFTIAGLWERWSPPQGDDIYSFTLITQEPNSFMKNIHNRMPAILLDKEQEKNWLDDDIPPEDLLDMLQPPPDEIMEAYTVPKRVGNVRENDAGLIERYHYKELEGNPSTEQELF